MVHWVRVRRGKVLAQGYIRRVRVWIRVHVRGDGWGLANSHYLMLQGTA